MSDRTVAAVLARQAGLQGALHVIPYRPHEIASIPSRVLEEDDYVSILQSIIERDYFPDLYRLRARRALLKAAGCNTSLDGDESSLANENVRRRVKLLDGREFEVDINRLSLSEFQALFTSEDAASFEKLIVAEKSRLAKEQAWMERAALEHNELNEATRKAIEAGKRPNRLVFSNVVPRNALMFPISSSNAGVLEIWPSSSCAENGADGLLSLPPGGASAADHKADDNALPSSSAAVNAVALKCGTKFDEEKAAAAAAAVFGTIVRSNTRFTEEEVVALSTELAEKQESKLLARERARQEGVLLDRMTAQGVFSLAAAIDDDGLPHPATGRQRRDNKSSSFPTSHRGSNFVHTPAFSADELRTPMMTWGSVGGTPLRLADDDDAAEECALNSSSKGPSADRLRFSLPDISAKEAAAQRLSDSVGRKQKISKEGSNLLRLARTLAASPRRPSQQQRWRYSELFFSPAISGSKLLRNYTTTARTPNTGMLGATTPGTRTSSTSNVQIPFALLRRSARSTPLTAPPTTPLASARGLRSSVSTTNLMAPAAAERSAPSQQSAVALREVEPAASSVAALAATSSSSLSDDNKNDDERSAEPLRSELSPRAATTAGPSKRRKTDAISTDGAILR